MPHDCGVGRLEFGPTAGLVTRLPLAAYVERLDGPSRQVQASSAVEALLGYPAAAWGADPDLLDRVVHPEDRARVAELRAHRRAEGGQFGLEYRAVRADGRVVRLRERGVADGVEAAPRLCLGVLLDVTDELQTVQALQEGEARLRQLDRVPALVWTTDGSLRLTSLLGSLARDGGLDGLVELFEDDRECPLRIASRAALVGAPAPLRLELDGRTLEGQVEPLRDRAGQPSGTIGIVLDVTGRVQAEERLRRQEDRLREAQRLEALGRLAGGVAHDFNNVLTAIAGSTHLLLADTAPDDPRRAQLEQIQLGAERARTLAEQLLVVAGRHVRDPRPTDVNTLVRYAEAHLRQLAGAGVDLVVDLAPGPALASVDPAGLEEALVCLVRNAGEALDGPGAVGLQTVHEFRADGAPAVRITVRDSGRGIDPRIRERIFEPYFSTKPERAGMGLPTVHGIVRRHGGEVTVDSLPGEGTSVHVLLPATGSLDGASDGVAVGLAAGSERILVVDDEDLVRNVVRAVLERAGYSVVAVSSAAAALAELEASEDDFDLVLSDIVMPGMSGRHLAARVAERHPGLRIALMTGHDDGEPVAGLEQLPLFRKPFTPAELAAAVRDVLDVR
ncbi:MAG: response regulator [Thermoleophilia bacterium]